MTPLLFKVVAAAASVNCPESSGGVCNTGLPQVSANGSQITNALNIFFGIAGAISVLMIIIGALMFVTSGGNPQNVQKARETILYSVVGLVISLSAVGFVNFVLGHL